MILGIPAAARCLRAGEVVAYPTETVYGLGVDALSAESVARLQQLKGRGADRGLSVLLAVPDELERWVPGLPARARRLARAFWPGPLTLVVPVPAGRFDAVATDQGVGFRCSPQPTAAALAAALGSALVTTSANRSGEPPCTSAAQVETCFGVELPIAGGEDAGGAAPSTVIALGADGALRILREGPIDARKIHAIA